MATDTKNQKLDLDKEGLARYGIDRDAPHNRATETPNPNTPNNGPRSAHGYRYWMGAKHLSADGQERVNHRAAEDGRAIALLMAHFGYEINGQRMKAMDKNDDKKG